MTRFNTSSSAFTPTSDSALGNLSASIEEGGPLPTDDALAQLGRALMTELLDVISDTALEDFQTILGEALIGAFHSAAGRIFDALNWAKQEWPDMALATTGAKGSEKLAIKWAQQKGVKLILARADFDTHGKAAPFRANDELIALEPEVCLTLVHSVDRARADQRPFGPALNFGQKAMESGLRHVSIKARAA
ncbi:MAG: DUF2493 domain-containing protein [Phenylobacterium sp.]|nr:DUF2493 domain-containing protein [Phenylobacterium sp.]